MSLTKVVLLNQYSDKRANFKIKLILDLENWQSKLKGCHFLKGLNQKALQVNKKKHYRCSFRSMIKFALKLLIFIKNYGKC